MATKQINVSSPVLNINGKNTVTTTITWDTSSISEDAIISGAVLTGTWIWNGKGSVSQMLIGGTSTTDSIAFSHTLSNSEISSKSIQISATGANKNVTGNSFTWTALIVTYTYSTSSDVLYQKQGSVWVEIPVITGYKKIRGVWVEQDLNSLFDINTKYVKGVI